MKSKKFFDYENELFLEGYDEINNIFKEYCGHRKQIGRPPTYHAVELLRRKVLSWLGQYTEKEVCSFFESSILCGWIGVFEKKPKQTKENAGADKKQNNKPQAATSSNIYNNKNVNENNKNKQEGDSLKNKKELLASVNLPEDPTSLIQAYDKLSEGIEKTGFAKIGDLIDVKKYSLFRDTGLTFGEYVRKHMEEQAKKHAESAQKYGWASKIDNLKVLMAKRREQEELRKKLNKTNEQSELSIVDIYKKKKELITQRQKMLMEKQAQEEKNNAIKDDSFLLKNKVRALCILYKQKLKLIFLLSSQKENNSLTNLGIYYYDNSRRSFDDSSYWFCSEYDDAFYDGHAPPFCLS